MDAKITKEFVEAVITAARSAQIVGQPYVVLHDSLDVELGYTAVMETRGKRYQNSDLAAVIVYPDGEATILDNKITTDETKQTKGRIDHGY